MHGLLAAAVITVRIYNYAAVPGAELASAEAAAAVIFQGTAISIAWRVCALVPNQHGTECGGPLGRDELIIRLMESSTEAVRGPVSMGTSLIERDSGRGVLATIDPRLAISIAQQSGVDTGVMLGRAMAHELGHLLLASTAHSEGGLMRALWTQAELRANRSDDWSFSTSEADRMRRRLARSMVDSRQSTVDGR